MVRVGLAALALTLGLSACVHLPNTALSKASVEGTYGALTPATPLAAIIQQQHIQPLDPAAKTPLLDQAMVALAKTDPSGRYHGVTYDLTKDNKLERDWLVQTPDIWGRHSADLSYQPLDCKNCEPDFRLPFCEKDTDCAAKGSVCGRLAAFDASPALAGKRVCLGHSDALVDRFYRLIASARRAVDITTLQPAPDYRFLAALRNGITRLARSGRSVTVRILVGQYPPDGVDAKQLLEQLVRDARTVRNARVTVYAAAMRSCAGDPSCGSFTWNHAKILAVDGKVALVGGHNMWTEDYLLDQPVHDLSMEIRGGAALDAHHFADALWQFVCDHVGGDAAVSAFIYRGGGPDVDRGCLPGIKLPARGRAGASGIPVLAVGRLGAGVTDNFASQNDLARDLLFGAARHSIRIAQQDVVFTLGGFDAIYPESTLERWLDFLLAGRGDIYLVLSNLDAKGRSKSEYSNGLPLEAVARKMLDMARARSQLSPAFLADLLCTHFHLASFRFGPDAAWPGGNPIGNHGKFWMVDDRYLYIGSDNIYPVDLQEFGYIVDSRDAAAKLLQSYWDPLWRWSRGTAVSGNGAPRCVLRDQRHHSQPGYS